MGVRFTYVTRKYLLVPTGRVSELGYLAGAGAVTLARLQLRLKYLFNNSHKLHGT